MKFTRLLTRTLCTSGVVLFGIAGSAFANNISFTTNASNTGFNNGTNRTLNQTSGVNATLTFVPNTVSSTGTPSNVNYGDFLLTCTTCSTQSLNTASATFGSFNFELVLTDNTDGATGIFTGTSTGGTVYSDVSPIIVSWTPAMFGPNTVGATSGNFGNTTFTINTTTRIVAPNSGTPPGDTTVQGGVDTFTSGTPEPATFGLIGSALLAVGFAKRKKHLRS